MLSIDITDKQLKLVKGSLSGSKIRVTDVESRDVPEGSIVNGYITNIPLVASEITDIFDVKKISEKEITVCINSSAILYKEMEVPKPKSLKNTAAIEAMIIAQMGIASDYNVSYSIVGEGVDDEKRPVIKLMATACPQRMVEGYQGLFNQLGMRLKQINISNNCITRLILNAPKLKENMPFMCIQVDVDFININLYEEGQVALSRYVKIDPADYENNPDYINIAVFDNLFRMIQFIGQRPGSKPLKRIMFYGIIKDFVSLSNAISSFNIPAFVLAMPNNIINNCELDFSRYANAIGAFYKVDPLYEHINLLQSKAVKSKKSSSMFPVKVLLVAAVASGVIFGLRWWIDSVNSDLKKDIKLTDEWINDPIFEQRKSEIEELNRVLENTQSYKYSVLLAEKLFEYQPVFLPQIREKVAEVVDDVLSDASSKYTNIGDGNSTSNGAMFVYFDDLILSGYEISTVIYTNDIDFPSDFVEALEDHGFFVDVRYRGFSAETWGDIDSKVYERLSSNSPAEDWITPYGADRPDSDGKLLKFELTFKIQAGHYYDGGKAYVYEP